MQTSVTDFARLKKHQERHHAEALRHVELPRELGVRLLDHLEGLNIAPNTVLNVGEGLGALTTPLKSRFPQSRQIHLDLSARALGTLQPKGLLRRWIGRPPALIAARADALPIATATVDLVILQGMSALYALPTLFKECRRVLNQEGLILLYAFGPDSLKEWRNATASSPFYVSPPAFTDMHDVADTLGAAGFASPVVDMETLTLKYSQPDALLRDLRVLGGSDALQSRTPGLKTQRALKRVTDHLKVDQPEGLTLTLELIYGHAWNPSAQKSASGHRIIPIGKA
jgi:malonyl-CoA O-methyltransferase